MKTKIILLDPLAKLLLNGEIWGHIQAIVRMVESPSLTGEQKRYQALQRIKYLSFSIASFLMNLGLEMAVAKLRLTQTSK